MDGINETATIESPLKPIPFAQLYLQHGFHRNVVDDDDTILVPRPLEEFTRMLHPIQKKQDDDIIVVPRPLEERTRLLHPIQEKKDDDIIVVPRPLEELTRLLRPIQENEIETDNLKIKSKKSIVQNNKQNFNTFKVPNKVSLAIHNNNGNSSFRNSLFQAKTKRRTSICNGNDIPTTSSQEKIVPYRNHKIIKTKKSRIPKATSSNITAKSTLDTQTLPGRSTEPIPMLQKRDVPKKLLTDSIEDFELAQTYCVLQSPSNIYQDWERMIKLQIKLTSLSTEISAVSTEINELCQQIQSNFRKGNNKATRKRVRSPFMKVRSINSNNLRKTTLLKTVIEIPTIEKAATSQNAADDEMKIS